MVGPFMQGLLLLGIIYWYSKGMLSLINDYYRSEFQHKFKSDVAKNVAPAEHVEHMQKLIEMIADNATMEAFEQSEEDWMAQKQFTRNVRRAVCVKRADSIVFLDLIVLLNTPMQAQCTDAKNNLIE